MALITVFLCVAYGIGGVERQRQTFMHTIPFKVAEAALKLCTSTYNSFYVMFLSSRDFLFIATKSKIFFTSTIKYAILSHLLLSCTPMIWCTRNPAWMPLSVTNFCLDFILLRLVFFSFILYEIPPPAPTAVCRFNGRCCIFIGERFAKGSARKIKSLQLLVRAKQTGYGQNPSPAIIAITPLLYTLHTVYTNTHRHRHTDTIKPRYCLNHLGIRV